MEGHSQEKIPVAYLYSWKILSSPGRKSPAVCSPFHSPPRDPRDPRDPREDPREGPREDPREGPREGPGEALEKP